jgi:ABC-type uncharacterized transport system permease subunit
MTPEAARAAAGRLCRLAGLGILLVILAVGIIALTVALLGGDPARALTAIHLGSVARPRSLTETLIRATPLLLCGLGVAIAFRCGLWNIGAEGQFLIGMLGSSLAATLLPPMPPVVGPLLCLAAGALAGAAWAGIAALLRVYRGVSEVIGTIMLNFLAVYLLEYLVRGPLRDPASVDEVGAALPAWARLPRFSRSLGVGEVGFGAWSTSDGTPVLALGVDAGYLHGGVLLALAAAGALWVWQARSGLAFRIRAVGANPEAAAAAGIRVAPTLLAAFLLSGALAGLAGGVEQLATVSRLHRYAAGEPGYGFSGIAVALLGGLQPAGVAGAALFFGALRAGCDQMQRSAGVSFHVAYVLQAVLVLLLLAGPRLRLGKDGSNTQHPNTEHPTPEHRTPEHRTPEHSD